MIVRGDLVVSFVLAKPVRNMRRSWTKQYHHRCTYLDCQTTDARRHGNSIIHCANDSSHWHIRATSGRRVRIEVKSTCLGDYSVGYPVAKIAVGDQDVVPNQYKPPWHRLHLVLDAGVGPIQTQGVFA